MSSTAVPLDELDQQSSSTAQSVSLDDLDAQASAAPARPASALSTIEQLGPFATAKQERALTPPPEPAKFDVYNPADLEAARQGASVTKPGPGTQRMRLNSGQVVNAPTVEGTDLPQVVGGDAAHRQSLIDIYGPEYGMTAEQKEALGKGTPMPFNVGEGGAEIAHAGTRAYHAFEDSDANSPTRELFGAGTEALSGAMTLASPSVGRAFINAPLKTAGGFVAGMGASEAAGAIAHHYGMSPEGEEFVRSAAFFAPTAFGVVSGLRTGTIETPQGRFSVASVFGGRARAGVATTPEAYDVRAQVGGTTIGARIPRPAAPPPSEPAKALMDYEQHSGNPDFQEPAPKPVPPGTNGPAQHLSHELVKSVSDLIQQTPPEARAPAMLEAHENMVKWMMGRGTFIGPDAKVYTVDNVGQAKKLASTFINDEVDRIDKARDDAAKAAEAAKPAETPTKAPKTTRQPQAATQPAPAEQTAQPGQPTSAAGQAAQLPTKAPVSGQAGDAKPMGHGMTQDSPAVDKVAQEAQLHPEQKPLVMVKKETPADEAALAQPPEPVSSTDVSKIGQEDKASGRQIVQPSNDEMQNERLAGESAPVLATQLSHLSASVPGITFDRMRPQKNLDRVDEKVEGDDKPPKTIQDYLAAQVAAETPEAKDRMIAQMRKSMDVLSVEDKFLEGRPNLAGYPSANVQVRMPNGSTAEVQIVPREVQEITDTSHRHYTDGRKAEIDGDKEKAEKNHAEASRINTEALNAFRERNGLQPLKYSYGSTQVNIDPESELGKAHADAVDSIPQSHLGKNGRETAPHVTVRYGLNDASPEQVEKIKAAVANIQPFEAPVGKTDTFPASKQSDGEVPVIARLEVTPELKALRSAIEKAGDFNEDTFPEYKPHITLAYVKPEFAHQYKGGDQLEGQKVPVREIAVTKRDGSQEMIPLGGGQATGKSVPLDELEHVERRTNPSQRKRVQEMSGAEKDAEIMALRAERLTSEKTGLPNYKAFQEDEGQYALVGYADIDDFKQFNTILGHAAVDRKVLPKIGELFKAAAASENLKVYHRSGDEFLFRSDDAGSVSRVVNKVNEQLKEAVFTAEAPDGTIYEKRGAGLSHGTGKDEHSAERAAEPDKQARKEAGLRSGARDVSGRVGEKPAQGLEAGGREATQSVPLEELDKPTTPDVSKEQAFGPLPGKSGEVDPRQLTFDPKRFQYKLNVNEKGVTNLLAGRRWNPDLAGIVSVWHDPADGNLYVINGHHRAQLAVEKGVGSVLVRHIEAPTAKAARAIGALQNIAEGRGTAVDAAKFLRDSGIGPDELEKHGISMGEATAAKGLALSKLDPSIFEKVATGKMSEGRGIAIGEATDDPAQQEAIVKLIDKRETQGKNVTEATVSELARFVANSGNRTVEQGGLFGANQEIHSLALEKAEISAYIKQQIGKERRAFGAVATEERAKALAQVEGQQIKAEENKRISQQAAQAEEAYNKLSSRSGAVNEALEKAARELASGNYRPEDVKQRAYAAVREEVRKAISGGETGGIEGREGAPGPGKGDDEALLSREAVARQTETPEFKKWFGESKVINSDGTPMVVYHGTDRDFTSFEIAKDDIGIHFGTAGQASDRMALKASKYFRGSRLLPVFLKIENPLRLNDLGQWDAGNTKFALVRKFPGDARKIERLQTEQHVRDFIKSKGHDGIVYKNEGEAEPDAKERQNQAWENWEKLLKSRGRTMSTVEHEDLESPEWRAWLKANHSRNAKDSYIAFDPSQIKSAIGNRGTFSPDADNILANLSKDDLFNWAKAAGSRIKIEPMGEQGGLFGGNEKMFRLSTSKGNSITATEAQLKELGSQVPSVAKALKAQDVMADDSVRFQYERPQPGSLFGGQRPPLLTISRGARDLISQMAGTGRFSGMNMSVGQARKIAESLRALKTEEIPEGTNRTDVYELANGLISAAHDAGNSGITLHKENASQKVIEEEQVHAGQRQLGKGDVSEHLSNDAMNRVLAHPATNHFLSDLRGQGYTNLPKSSKVAEIAAHIATGQHSLESEQAADWFTNYVAELHKEHDEGNVAAAFANMYDGAQELYEQARQELEARAARSGGSESGIQQAAGGVSEHPTGPAPPETRRGNRQDTAGRQGSLDQPFLLSRENELTKGPGEEDLTPPASVPDVSKGEPPDSTGSEPGSMRASLLGADILAKQVANFYKQDIAPVVKGTAGGIKEITKLGLQALAPRVNVPSQALDTAMRMKGQREEELFRFDATMKATEKMFNKLPEAERVAFIDRVMQGQPQPTVELRNIADMFEQALDRFRNIEKQFNKNLSDRPNYFPIRYRVLPKSGIEKGHGGRRPLEGSKAFMKQKTYQDLSSAMADGGVPITTNPVGLLRARIEESLKFTTARSAFDEWTATPYTVDKNGKLLHIAQFFKQSDWQKARSFGYEQVEDKMFNVLFPAQSGEGLIKSGEYWVEKNTARILNNFLSRDLIRETGAGRGLVGIKNGVTAWRLGFSPFHAITETFLTTGSEIGRGLEHAWNQGVRQASLAEMRKGTGISAKSFGAAYRAAREGGSAIRYVTDPQQFLQTSRGQDFIKKYPQAAQLIADMFSGGAKLAMHEDYRLKFAKSLQAAIADNNYIGALLRTPGATAQAVQYPLFELYIPRLKMGMFLREYSEALADRDPEIQAGKLTREKLAREIWDNIDYRFGEVNWDNFFFNRTFKTALQLAFRAPMWAMGNAAFTGSAIKGQASEFAQSFKFLRDAASGKQNSSRPGTTAIPKIDPRMAKILGMLVVGLIAHALLQWALTGKPPEDPKDLVAPRDGTTDKHGEANRLSFPLVPFRDIESAKNNPSGYVHGKFADIWTGIPEVLNNRDFQNKLIYYPDDPDWEKWAKSAEHIMGMPISADKFRQAHERGETPRNSALEALGLSRVGKQATMSAAEKKMREIQAEHYGGQTDEELEAKEKKDARIAAGNLKPTERRQQFRENMKNEFERGMEHFSYDQALQVYQAASPEEKALMGRILLEKRFNQRRTAVGVQ